MHLNQFKSLPELFFFQAKKQNHESNFLKWLNPINKKSFTWGDTTASIYKLNKVLQKHLKNGDRCLLVSENRPEWLISDLAIMLTGAITVPAYTTYTESDYKYLIEDCEPSIIIISNTEMYKKLKKTIDTNDFIK